MINTQIVYINTSKEKHSKWLQRKHEHGYEQNSFSKSITKNDFNVLVIKNANQNSRHTLKIY